jgi:hypothetical protein
MQSDCKIAIALKSDAEIEELKKQLPEVKNAYIAEFGSAACREHDNRENLAANNANKAYELEFSKRNRIFKEYRNGVLIKTWRE